MKEARVICRVQTGYQVSDTNPPLKFEYQKEVYLPESIALSSRQLMQAAKAGALSLQWVERYQMKKPDAAIPPWLRQRGKSVNRHPATPDTKETTTPVTPSVSQESAVPIQKMLEQAAHSMDQNTKNLLAKMQEDLARVVAEAVAKESAKTERLIQEALSRGVAVSVPTPSSNRSIPAPEDDPISFGEEKFIPSSLSLQDVGTVSMKIDSQESSVSNVDEAVAALQKKRRGKKHE